MERSSKLNGVLRPRIVHVTTAHRADDVRIFDRECRSLADCGRYEVFLAAAGGLPGGGGSRVNFIPLTPAPAGRVGRLVSGPRKAMSLTRAVSADLWHFHDPELLPVAVKLAKSGAKVIWDAHEDYGEQFSQGEDKSWVPLGARTLVRLGMVTLLVSADRNAAGVVAATTTIASRYRNARTVVVGNEARLEDFASCQPAFDSRIALFTGHLGPDHLFPEILEAIKHLPDVTLEVAGRDPNPELWRYAQSVLGDRIRHLGWLDRPGLAAAVSRASIGLVTYADISTNAANSPNKIFEFSAAGLPFVASPTPANTRFVRDGGGGFLASGFSADALSDAVSAALSDRLTWKSAQREGREWAKRVGSWETSQRRLLDLYQEILGC